MWLDIFQMRLLVAFQRTVATRSAGTRACWKATHSIKERSHVTPALQNDTSARFSRVLSWLQTWSNPSCRDVSLKTLRSLSCAPTFRSAGPSNVVSLAFRRSHRDNFRISHECVSPVVCFVLGVTSGLSIMARTHKNSRLRPVIQQTLQTESRHPGPK